MRRRALGRASGGRPSTAAAEPTCGGAPPPASSACRDRPAPGSRRPRLGRSGAGNIGGPCARELQSRLDRDRGNAQVRTGRSRWAAASCARASSWSPARRAARAEAACTGPVVMCSSRCASCTTMRARRGRPPRRLLREVAISDRSARASEAIGIPPIRSPTSDASANRESACRSPRIIVARPRRPNAAARKGSCLSLPGRQPPPRGTSRPVSSRHDGAHYRLGRSERGRAVEGGPSITRRRRHPPNVPRRQDRRPAPRSMRP